jgi:hypothetical protein
MNYSNELVKIPSELGFLTDYTQTGYSYQGNQIQVSYPIVNGVKQTTPRFTFRVDINGVPPKTDTIMTEFATAFLSEGAPPKVVSVTEAGTILQEFDASYGQFLPYTFTLNATGAVKSTSFKPIKYFVKLVAFGGKTVGMTVQEAIAHLAPDFEVFILSYTKPDGQPSGLVYAKDADPNGIINGQTVYDGYVTLERVIKDCIASNTYSVNRRTGVVKFVGGLYKDIPRDCTVDTLPEKYFTKIVHNYTQRPNCNSVFVYLTLQDGKVKNNSFINKQVYSPSIKVYNPSGAEITPLWVVSLVNGGPDFAPGGYSIRAMAQSVVWSNSFDEFTLVELTDLTKEGYIDANTKTVYYRPDKKAVLRVELMQAAQNNNPMAKSWGVEGAINLQTGAWSKFFEILLIKTT